NDRVVSKTTTKDKVKSLALKAKVTRVIDSNVAIASAMVLIGLKKATKIALGTKEGKALNKGKGATIAV
ncbi:hypothetical protein Tco_1157704, partial [Tanacetum coccineum]